MNAAQFETAVARVCVAFDVTRAELLGRRRPQRIAWPRQVLYYALRSCGWLVVEIGDAVGRDHSTVCTGIVHVKHRVTYVGVDRALVQSITAGLERIGNEPEANAVDVLDTLIARLTAERDELRRAA